MKFIKSFRWYHVVIFVALVASGGVPDSPYFWATLAGRVFALLVVFYIWFGITGKLSDGTDDANARATPE